MFDYPKADMQQFTHRRTEGGHFALTAGQQALIEVAHIRIVAAGNDRGHIELGAQQRRPGLGQQE